ncbi:MAG TPA: hypothetical protein DF613_01940 [Lachnospiraceae bacterium]|nr:hypothetical protein [Lachnospiraceae bacterium]
MPIYFFLSAKINTVYFISRGKRLEKKINGRVSEADAGIRLEHFLKNRLHLTKNEISRAKFREKGICVNGERRRISAFLESGDLVEVLLEGRDEFSKSLRISVKDIAVLYEDEDVIIIDKPAGISVHPTGKKDSDTMANRLSFYLQSKGQSSVIRILGRLDKDTSGVLLAAKNRAAATRLERQRETGIFFKSYLAVAENVPDPASGQIHTPLVQDIRLRNRMCTAPKGKRAVTHYETIEAQGNCALLGLRLETGRTHQIRVHMASIGCPLIGDPMYGNGSQAEMNRTALHARSIHFLHPFTGKELLVEAPVPEDMRGLISRQFGLPRTAGPCEKTLTASAPDTALYSCACTHT